MTSCENFVLIILDSWISTFGQESVPKFLILSLKLFLRIQVHMTLF